MNFTAPWDNTVKGLTCGVIALLAVIYAVVYVAMRRAGAEEIGWVSYLVLGVFVLIVAGAYAFAPRGFRIVGGEVHIVRPLGPIRIPLREVQEVRRLDRSEIGGAIRTMGSGGLFGFYGFFRNKRLGNFRMYVTDRSRLVLLRANGTFVLSPDRPDVFVETVRSYVGQSG